MAIGGDNRVNLPIGSLIDPPKRTKSGRIRFEPWQVAMIATILGMVILVIISPNFREAYNEVVPQGIVRTLRITGIAFVAANGLGLFIGLGRVSTNKWIKNISSYYVEFVRGVPVIVFIFFIALSIIPDTARAMGIPTRSVGMEARATISLSLFYAAFIAEVVRAGMQSVDRGQVEAGLSIGLHPRKVTRLVVLPQAVRNVFPAFANDLIALFKDTSLVSVLAVNEMTQEARLYSGSSFRFFESFVILMVAYVAITAMLSFLLGTIEKKIAIPGRL